MFARSMFGQDTSHAATLPDGSALPRLETACPLTRVDDLAARVQVVQSNEQLAGEVAHRRQRDAAVLVQPAQGHARTACWADGARITGTQAEATKSGCACPDIGRHTAAWYGMRSRRHARVRQPSRGLLRSRHPQQPPSPDEREQVVSKDLKHHAHVAAVRAGMLKPVHHAAAVVLVLCTQDAPTMEQSVEKTHAPGR